MMKRRSKASSGGLEFFKVFLPSSSSLHMCIPPAFVKHFNEELPTAGIIKDGTGLSWHVSMEKLDNGVCFKNGWEAFVDGHSLKYGDFLIFQYDGNQMFDVKVFGKNGLKKEPAVVAATPVPMLKIKRETQEEKEDEMPLLPCKRKRLDVMRSTNSDTVRRSTRIANLNVKECDAPKGPCFERIMKRSSKDIINISKTIVDEHKIQLQPKVALRDEDGKVWPVSICSTTQNRVYLSSGWSKFYEAHNLRENDTCHFEFVFRTRNACPQINVRVTRHSLASPPRITWHT